MNQSGYMNQGGFINQQPGYPGGMQPGHPGVFYPGNATPAGPSYTGQSGPMYPGQMMNQPQLRQPTSISSGLGMSGGNIGRGSSSISGNPGSGGMFQARSNSSDIAWSLALFSRQHL